MNKDEFEAKFKEDEQKAVDFTKANPRTVLIGALVVVVLLVAYVVHRMLQGG